MKSILQKAYTTDAYTLVRNHPLIIVSQQHKERYLTQHPFHITLRRSKFNSFGTVLFFLSFFAYITYLGLLTELIVRGKHPQHFYQLINETMNLDLPQCENVSKYFLNNREQNSEAFKSEQYRKIKFALYGIMSTFIVKNVVVFATLFPKVLTSISVYIEISAVVLSYVYVLDWFDWQNDVIFRCPIQYQLGAMGLLLSYMNLLSYMRTTPVQGLGVYTVMLQVITRKFIRFLPIFMIIVSGFGLTYWMLLQNQSVYGTPQEAIVRTMLMLFDLAYESRLYGEKNASSYYRLVYLIFLLTAVVCAIFVMNLLIGMLY